MYSIALFVALLDDTTKPKIKAGEILGKIPSEGDKNRHLVARIAVERHSCVGFVALPNASQNVAVYGVYRTDGANFFDINIFVVS